MNFLLDVHVAMRLARFLSKHGHDVVHAGIAHPVATDRELLAIAVEEQRILVTEDRDFSELVFVKGEKPRQVLSTFAASPLSNCS